jgi:hypothetical protein
MPEIRIVDGRPTPCVNVKDDVLWTYHREARAAMDALDNTALVESIYDGIVEDFWYDVAPDIAREHGYGNVWQDGRSGGWLYVDHPKGFGEEGEEAFLAFASDIRGAVKAAQEMFIQRLQDAVRDLEARREEMTIRSNN